MFVTPCKAAKYYHVSKETLRKWALSEKIRFITTSGGHRRYEILSSNESPPIRKSIIYVRVSSSKQKEDLKRQIKFVKEKFPKYKVIKDIGSGFNFERKGFLFLVESILNGTVKEIAIAHPDRLTRIGYEFILYLCQHFNTKLRVLSNKEDSSPEEEFTDEFISVITYYTSKFHGMRRYNLLQKN